MSKPRYAWYGEVRRRITEGHWKEPKTFQDYILNKAIYEAKIDTERLPNGTERLKAIDAILIKDKTYTQTEMEMFFSWRTLQNWTTSFVNLVGKKAGF